MNIVSRFTNAFIIRIRTAHSHPSDTELRPSIETIVLDVPSTGGTWTWATIDIDHNVLRGRNLRFLNQCVRRHRALSRELHYVWQQTRLAEASDLEPQLTFKSGVSDIPTELIGIVEVEGHVSKLVRNLATMHKTIKDTAYAHHPVDTAESAVAKAA